MTTTIRASALSDFFDCAARAEAKHLLGRKMPSSPKALLGTAIHKSTAVYDQSKLDAIRAKWPKAYTREIGAP